MSVLILLWIGIIGISVAASSVLGSFLTVVFSNNYVEQKIEHNRGKMKDCQKSKEICEIISIRKVARTNLFIVLVFKKLTLRRVEPAIEYRNDIIKKLK